jgi:hypothetical protein
MADGNSTQSSESRSGAIRKFLTAENFIVFLLNEAIGLPFCYEAPDLVMHGEIMKGLLSFSIGLPFVVLGAAWPFVREQVSKSFADSVKAVFLDFRGWLAIALAASICIFGPGFLVGQGICRRVIFRARLLSGSKT